MLLKFTIIWVVPSKILGAVVGLLETWVYVYLVLILLSAFNVTSSYILESKTATFMLDNTPVIKDVFNGAYSSAKEMYKIIEEYEHDENKDTNSLNLRILQIEIANKLITKDKAQELVDTRKIDLGDVKFGKGVSLWLNI